MDDLRALILTFDGAWRGHDLPGELDDIGIGYQVVDGVDGMRLTDERIAALYSRHAAWFLRQPLSRGEIACVLGHQMMMRTFLESDDEWALLLEDDAKLEPQSRTILGLCDRKLNRPTIVQLQHLGNFGGGPSLQMESSTQLLVQTQTPVAGAVAYLINRAAAHVALQTYTDRQVDSVADWPFHWKNRVKFYACWPTVARQRSSAPSMIGSSRTVSQAASTVSIALAPARMLARALGLKAMIAPIFGVSAQAQWRHDRIALQRRLRRSTGWTYMTLDELT